MRSIDQTFATNAATGTASMTIALPISPGEAASPRTSRWRTTAATATARSASGGGPSCRRSAASSTSACRRTTTATRSCSAGATTSSPTLHGQTRLRARRRAADAPWSASAHAPRPPSSASSAGPASSRQRRALAHAGHRQRDHPVRHDGESRVADPDDPSRIVTWLTCARWDARGNAMVAEYVADDAAGIAAVPRTPALPHPACRHPLPRSSALRQPSPQPRRRRRTVRPGRRSTSGCSASCSTTPTGGGASRPTPTAAAT